MNIRILDVLTGNPVIIRTLERQPQERLQTDSVIVVCTSGIGISIAANKVPGIRCALCTDPYMAKMTRLHNDANMLALGGGIVGKNLAIEIVETFLNTEFSEGENHVRRIAKLED